MSNRHLFLNSAFLRVPSQNGIGRHVCQLQRLVIKFCKNHGGSKGTRDFIENHLVDFAKENPGVAVYLKPRRHRSPVLVGEFLNGERKWLSIHQKSCEEVAAWIDVLLGSHGGDVIRYRKPQYTDYPTIQGCWEPKHNLLTQSRLPSSYPSPAMDKIISLAKEQGLIKE